MPLKAVNPKGNMYPWVTHTHAHLGGECPHRCVYCYVDNPRFGRPARYKGPVRLIEDELAVPYGLGKTIFIEHMNDLWIAPTEIITRILDHCRQWPGNTYVFQTKNPSRYLGNWCWPHNVILGTTIETNRDMHHISTAPIAQQRVDAMRLITTAKKFVTIEPVLDFDVDILAAMIHTINPFFVNLGADSKGRGLAEPTVEKIMRLVDRLSGYGIELREKHNLKRLKP